MRTRTYRTLRACLRDMGFGAMLFLLLPAIATTLTNPHDVWKVSQAAAGEAIASRAIEVTAPPGPTAENAIVAAAQMRPARDPLIFKRISDFLLAALTFSLLFAMNLALWRHLRRVNASPRRDAWRRRS